MSLSRQPRTTPRRNFVRGVLAAATGVASVPLSAVASAAQQRAASPGSPPSGYGSLRQVTGVEGVNGVRLLSGFSIRVVAESGRDVPGTNFDYRSAPDGAATFPADDQGWYLTVNHEISRGGGGVSSLHFRSDGSLQGAMSILDGTSRNCAGGPTPWGTWLSCEETDTGLIWECWPNGSRPGVARPAMGARQHEAAAVDEVNKVVYITEDRSNGKLWRFTPLTWPDLAAGTLDHAQTANRDGTGQVTWVEEDGTPFDGGEGIWYHGPSGKVYFSTKGDESIWELDTSVEPNRVARVWRGTSSPDSPLYDPDNVTVAEGSGDLFVAEDQGELRVVLITAEGQMSTFLQFDKDREHGGSEVTGPVFSPAGDRMYVSSQRGGPTNDGITYEITGPFRGASTPASPEPEPTATPTAPPEPAATPEATPAASASDPTTVPTEQPEPGAGLRAADDVYNGAGADQTAQENNGSVGLTRVATGVVAGAAVAGGIVAFRNRRLSEESTQLDGE